MEKTPDPIDFQHKEAENLGFGNRITGKQTRLLGKDGKYNVRTIGGRRFSLYQDLVELSWVRFFMVVIVFFIVINVFFAFLILMTGIDCLSGVVPGDLVLHFLHAWFFSVQTLTTVGYGSISPVCLSSNLVASFIALSGLVTFALVTGLVFARFSRPTSRIIFSTNALINPYRDGMDGFMFRLANRRENKIIDLEARVVMSWVSAHGQSGKKRQFQRFDLEVDRVAMLPLSWTIVHPIDDRSPLKGWSQQELKEKEVEVVVLIQGFDESYSQTIHASTSYIADEILSGYRFKLMYHPEGDGTTLLDLGKIDDMERIED